MLRCIGLRTHRGTTKPSTLRPWTAPAFSEAPSLEGIEPWGGLRVGAVGNAPPVEAEATYYQYKKGLAKVA